MIKYLLLLLLAIADAEYYYLLIRNSDIQDNNLGQAGDTADSTTWCNSDNTCVGFNTEGWIKTSGPIIPSSVVDLYIKQNISQPDRLSVLPKPISLTNGSTTLLILNSKLNFIATNPSNDLEEAFNRYNNLIFDRPSGNVSIQNKNRIYSKNLYSLDTVIVNVENVTVPLQLNIDESYTLQIFSDNTSAVITSATVYGTYRALETLSQLISFDYDLLSYRIPYTPIVIKDKPKFAYRGLLIDSARHFLPLKTIYSIIDSMTYAKLNVLHWHLVDMQSWPVQIVSRPLLWTASWSKSERYTTEDLQAVVEYARLRGVIVIPEFDTPGHSQAICIGYPEACPSLTNCYTPLNPVNNITFDIITDVFTDFSHVFPSSYFHGGGDEVDTTCWYLTPDIYAWMNTNGYTGDQTYEYFVMRTDEIIQGLNKIPIRWEEVWNHFGTQLPENTVIHVWLDHNTLINVTSSGYKAILSNSDVYYLDHLDVNYTSFYENDILESITHPENVLGAEVCMWGETADTSDVLQTIWPRAAAAAERQWSYDVTSNVVDNSVQQRLSDFRCLLNRRGIPAAPLTNSIGRSAPGGPGSCEIQ